MFLHQTINNFLDKLEAHRFKVDFRKLKDYFNRKGYAESYAELVVGDQMDHFAKFWTENGREIRKQLTIITVREIENDLQGEERKIFMRGILKLPNLWKECAEQQKKNIKVAEAKQAKDNRMIK